MTSKNMKYINFLLGLLLGFITMSISLSLQKKKNELKDNSYQYIGFADYSEDYVTPEELEDILKNRNVAFKDIQLETDVVKKSETVAKIGITVLEAKYGRKNIDFQKPFDVWLINKKIWLVKGKHVFVYIQKRNGQILFISKL